MKEKAMHPLTVEACVRSNKRRNNYYVILPAVPKQNSYE